jgi:hypothetical protein
LWKIIQAETNPMRQNILAPAREALARGLGVIDALKALNIFDAGTLAILSASPKRPISWRKEFLTPFTP